MIMKIYRTMLMKMLEIETEVKLINLYAKSLIIKSIVQKLNFKADQRIEWWCNMICERVWSSRDRKTYTKNTSDQRRIKQIEIHLKDWIQRENETSDSKKFVHQKRKLLRKYEEKCIIKWNQEWQEEMKNVNLKHLVSILMHHMMFLHNDRKKRNIILLTQLRTKKVNFNTFLSERNMSEYTLNCECNI